MSKTKKIIVMSTLVLLLTVTAVLNFILGDADILNDSGDAVTTSNYFTTYRTERITSRNSELLELDSVMALNEVGGDLYDEAVTMKLKIIQNMENELQIESLVKSIGFSDAVVSIGYNSDNANIFINSSELSMETATKIYKLIENETSISPEDVIIMPVYSEI